MNVLSGARVLITGGFGFIGSHLAHRLVSSGATITIADDYRRASREAVDNLGRRVRVLECDILSTKFLQYVRQADLDFIFHFASTSRVGDAVDDPLVDCETSILGSVGILEALRTTRRPTAFIFPSSAAVYGNPTRLPMEEIDPAFPISPYGVSKLSVERYLSVYARNYGTRGCSLRCFSVYGPRQRKLVIYEIIRRLLEDPSEIVLHGNGRQVRDFVYVQDVVDAFIVAAAKGELGGEIYNVGSGTSIAIVDLARLISDRLNVHPKYVFDDAVLSDPDCWTACIAKIGKLGFSPKVDITTGIGLVVDWALAHRTDEAAAGFDQDAKMAVSAQDRAEPGAMRA